MANVEAPRHGVGQETGRLNAKWASIAAFGALLIILGLAALFFSLIAAIPTLTLNGFLFLIAGMAEIGIGMHSRRWGRFFLWVIGGFLYIGMGALCICNPTLASVALTPLLGSALFAAGAVRVYLAARLPASPARIVVFLAAAATILLGLIVVSRWPSDSVYVIGSLLGVDLLLQGAGWMSFGCGLQRRG